MAARPRASRPRSALPGQNRNAGVEAGDGGLGIEREVVDCGGGSGNGSGIGPIVAELQFRLPEGEAEAVRQLHGGHLQPAAAERRPVVAADHPRALVGLDEQLARNVGRMHAHRDLAVVEAQADLLVVELRDDDVGVGADAHRGRAELQRGAAALVGDHAIAGGQQHAALFGHQATPPGEIWIDDSDVIIVPKRRILIADDWIDMVFTRGIYGVFPMYTTLNFTKVSTL